MFAADTTPRARSPGSVLAIGVATLLIGAGVLPFAAAGDAAAAGAGAGDTAAAAGLDGDGDGAGAGDDDGWVDEWEDGAGDDDEGASRAFFYWDFVASGFYSPQGVIGVPRGDGGEDHFELSPRPPGNYAGLDLVGTLGAGSWINRRLPAWLQVDAIDLHPRMVLDRLEDGDGTDRLAFAPQDFWIRFRPGGRDRLSLRVGQFVLPYGVSPILAPRHRFTLPVEALDLGLKWDWGIALKGPLGEYDWEIAATIGAGEALRSPHWLGGGSDARSYLLSGRLGAPSYWDLQYGASFLYGDLPILRGAAHLSEVSIARWRLGLDAFYKHGTYLMVGGQLTYGQDGLGDDARYVLLTGGRTADVLGSRLWLDWVVPGMLDLRLDAQLETVIRDLSTSGSDDTAVTVEASYSLTTAITLMLSHRHDIHSVMGGARDAMYFTVVFYGR